MPQYTVKQLAQLAGVTIKTLHHYDEIGLLQPARRTESNYRYYGEAELLRLQQILFYRDLNFPLVQIIAILDDPSFDLLDALRFHRMKMKAEAARYQQLIQTIDKTIDKLNNNNSMVTHEELYEGFPKEKVEDYRQEVIERWGKEEIIEAETRLKQLRQTEWKDLKTKQENVNQLLASLVGQDPTSPLVQAGIAQHFELINAFHPTPLERYLCLGKLYTDDERFRAYYENYQQGLAEFLHAGIEIFHRRNKK
ncbi:MAG: MerR family transcriptional regulator [Bacteroidota bacterium]